MPEADQMHLVSGSQTFRRPREHPRQIRRGFYRHSFGMEGVRFKRLIRGGLDAAWL